MKMIIALLVVLCAFTALSAQQPTPSPTRATAPARRFPKRVTPPSTKSAPPPTDFFVGEAKVDVTKDETVIKLGMAQHGSVLIELPANDGPRYIIPGDPEMATVDEKALERNKRAIVVRPGSLFVPPSPNRKARTPAATVTAQMRSGLVVTFLFYPVEDLAQNVHRCVLTYNRDEVVARRRAARLPVNLDTSQSQERRIETGQSTAAPTSISVNMSEADKSAEPETSPKSPEERPVNKPSEKTDAKAKAQPVLAPSTTISEVKIEPPTETLKTATQAALSAAVEKPKQFKKWTKAVHGLKLAVVEKVDAKDNFRTAVVAVRNASNASLKISPGNPDLSIEMLDDQGKPVNVQSVKQLYVAANSSSGAIAPGATAYYAIAYASPVIGAHQQLKIAVSQTSAADEPASLTVAANIR